MPDLDETEKKTQRNYIDLILTDNFGVMFKQRFYLEQYSILSVITLSLTLQLLNISKTSDEWDIKYSSSMKVE